MALKINTAPAAEPISTDEAKMHLRVDASDEDMLIQSYIKAARQHCEGVLNRQLVTATWELWLDNFPGKDHIDIPLPPLQAPVVTAGAFITGTVYRILSLGTTNFTLIGASANTVGLVFTATGAGTGTGTATASGIIKYYGTDDTEYSLSGTDYFVDTKSEPGRIVLGYGKCWPSSTLRPANGVCIIFIAGYGSAELVPENTKNAIRLIVGHLYEHREAVTDKPLTDVPLAVDALLGIDRVWPV
jgi:hypothetical protein